MDWLLYKRNSKLVQKGAGKMNERILNMILDEIEKLDALEENELSHADNLMMIKALYADLKEGKGSGFKYLKSKVENLMFKSGAARYHISVFTKEEAEKEAEYLKLMDKFYGRES